jgi:hypothetical protein
MKSIPICDFFDHVAFDTIRPLPKMSIGIKYVLVIDHYSKWCETHPVKECDATTTSKFLEEEIICQFGIPKYIFINNGSEWIKEF